MSDEKVETLDDTTRADHAGADEAGGGIKGPDYETSTTTNTRGIGTSGPLPEAAQNRGSAAREEEGQEEASNVEAVVHRDANSEEYTLENDGGDPDAAGTTAVALPDDPVFAAKIAGESAQDLAAREKETGDPVAGVVSQASSSQREQALAIDPLTAALQTLFRNVAQFVQGELQLATNEYNLLESMNLRAAQEYDEHGDFAAGLRVFVEQVKEKHENFRGYLQQIDEIDREVTHLEALVSTLDNYSSALYSKVMAAYGDQKPL